MTCAITRSYTFQLVFEDRQKKAWYRRKRHIDLMLEVNVEEKDLVSSKDSFRLAEVWLYRYITSQSYMVSGVVQLKNPSLLFLSSTLVQHNGNRIHQIVHSKRSRVVYDVLVAYRRPDSLNN